VCELSVVIVNHVVGVGISVACQCFSAWFDKVWALTLEPLIYACYASKAIPRGC